MRKLLLIFLIVFCFFQNNYAWDSTAAKYMPLQVGNTWVYFSDYHLPYPNPSGTGYIKYKIVGIVDSLNQQYYKFEERRISISGIGGCSIPYLRYLRFDSSTTNLMSLGMGCAGNEFKADSLGSRLNDWLSCYSTFYHQCTDTLITYKFNQNYSSKTFTSSNGNQNTKYLKNIGITRYFWYELMNWCADTLKGCVINGVLYGDTSTIVGINQVSTEVPNEFSLSQNYPNPFNPVTKIKFQIPLLRGVDAEDGRGVLTQLTIYDALGKEIAILVNQQLQPGSYEADWDASAYPSGVYYYKLESGSYSETKKMVLIK